MVVPPKLCQFGLLLFPIMLVLEKVTRYYGGQLHENSPCMHNAQENPAQSLAIGTVIDDTKLILGNSDDIIILLLLCNLDVAPDKLLTELTAVTLMSQSVSSPQ